MLSPQPAFALSKNGWAEPNAEIITFMKSGLRPIIPYVASAQLSRSNHRHATVAENSYVVKGNERDGLIRRGTGGSCGVSVAGTE